MSERDMLAKYGTLIASLSPTNVLQAARADMRRKVRNASAAKFSDPSYEHYAFHRKHVRKAVDAENLLVRALMEPDPGLTSDKFNTRLLYGDGALLYAAIRLARGEGDGTVFRHDPEAGDDRAALFA